jgi:Cdc6-like AAA superfamily ATPase
MKFYETHYEEYINALENYNIHPEMKSIYNRLPLKAADFGNMIIYGPCGSGKYSQSLRIIRKYSASLLKYDKKIKIQTDKQEYIYRISDIHYEVDMSLLGCNSKITWHEIFTQIVDIVSVKNYKCGIILCKNLYIIIFIIYLQSKNSTTH